MRDFFLTQHKMIEESNSSIATKNMLHTFALTFEENYLINQGYTLEEAAKVFDEGRMKYIKNI